MLVSDLQLKCFSYIRIFQIVFYYRLLQDIEYISLCYTGNPCHLSILCIVFVSVNLILLIYPSLTFYLVVITVFSVSVSLFLFCIQIHFYYFLDYAFEQYHIFVFL